MKIIFKMKGFNRHLQVVPEVAFKRTDHPLFERLIRRDSRAGAITVLAG
jgi:hypothetical protein